MAILAYLIEGTTSIPQFAVVADDQGFEYVFPAVVDKANPPLSPDEALATAKDAGMDFTNATELDYLDAATLGFSNLILQGPTQVENRNDGIDQAEDFLEVNYSEEDISTAQMLRRAAEASDALAEDDPEFDFDEATPQQMAEFVLSTLGDQDVNGPNGWLVRYVMGEDPLPGDENGYVHFNGTDTGPADEAEGEENDES